MSSPLGTVTSRAAVPTSHTSPSTSTRTASTATSSGTSTTGSATAATEADQTGYAARTARFGPLVGAVLGTTDLVGSALESTYDVASEKLAQTARTVQQAGHAVAELGTAAGKAWNETETALEQGAAKVSSGAKALASALETGAQKVGQWLDDVA